MWPFQARNHRKSGGFAGTNPGTTRHKPILAAAGAVMVYNGDMVQPQNETPTQLILPAGYQRPSPPRELVRYSGGRGGSSLTGGGLFNGATGLGGSADKGDKSLFAPTRIYWQSPLEVLAVESWATRNVLDIPIDDMFIRWRQLSSETEGAVETMLEAEERWNVRERLAKAMKAGRQYGSAVLVMMTNDAPGADPLIPERIRPGDLTNLLVLNRYEITVAERDYNLRSPTYGQAISYDLHPNRGGGERVHASRVLKFDGIEAPSDSGFSVYDWDWGVSILIPIINEILSDASIAANIAHLVHEASIPVIKIKDFDLAIAAGSNAEDPDTPSVEQIGASINATKSNLRTIMLDSENDFLRVAVQFGGLSSIMDGQEARVAAAAKIPQTRWMGRSPAGMNATGEGDMKNYILSFEAMRERMLTMGKMRRLDMVIARGAGLAAPPAYTWNSLLEMGEKEQADTAYVKVQAVGMAIDKGVIDEDEGRKILDGDPIFGELPGDAPELPEPMPTPLGGGDVPDAPQS